MKSVMMIAAIATATLTASAGNWEPFDGNPILGNAKLGTCFDVNVITDGPAPYTMYFSWRPKKAIALVRSDAEHDYSTVLPGAPMPVDSVRLYQIQVR